MEIFIQQYILQPQFSVFGSEFMNRLDRNQYMGKWRKKNKEEWSKYNSKWKQENKDKVKKHNKKYYQENSNKVLELNKQWRKENKEYFLKYMEGYYINNKDGRKECIKKYNKTENGKATKQRATYKRRIKIKNIINTLNSQEWLDILEAYNYKCAYCDVEFDCENLPTKDHIIPISKGGDNMKENIVPACRSCNSKKNNKILSKERR
jgi:5-methylcytosine-specific restriction endonuclease McrA